MRTVMSKVRATISLFLVSLIPQVAEGDFEQSLVTDPGRRVKVTVGSPLNPPLRGSYPLYVDIENYTDQTLTWKLAVSGRSSTYWFATTTLKEFLTVPSGSRKRFEVILPLLANVADESWSTPTTWITGEVSGFGISGGQFHVQTEVEHQKPALPYTLISSKLERRLASVGTTLGEANKTFMGDFVEVGGLPTDWRAYLGVEHLFLTAQEWQTTPSLVKVALKDWMLQGAVVHIVNDGNVETLGSEFGVAPIALGDRELYPLGLGQFIVEGVTEEEVNSSFLVDRITGFSMRSPLLSVSSEKTIPYGDLMKGFKERRLQGGFILGVVFIYGLLAGPINLFGFAKREFRYRLYWTTPLLAAGTTILLLVVIMLAEGTGGQGKRSITVVTDPSLRRAVILQEQVSRTSLLLSREFLVNDRRMMTPLLVPPDEQKKRGASYYTPGNTYEALRGNFAVTGEQYHGDWFQNRTIQAHLIEDIQPTRAEVQLLANNSGQPQVVSTIGSTLKELFYIDNEGNVWGHRHVRPGVRTELSRIEVGAHELLDNIGTKSGPVRRFSLELAKGRRGIFVAVADNASIFAVDTLPTLAWASDDLVLLGLVREVSVTEAL